jgi:hypothetical protein
MEYILVTYENVKDSSSTASWSLDSRSFLRASPPPSSSSPLPADLSAARFPLPLDAGLLASFISGASTNQLLINFAERS